MENVNSSNKTGKLDQIWFGDEECVCNCVYNKKIVKPTVFCGVRKRKRVKGGNRGIRRENGVGFWESWAGRAAVSMVTREHYRFNCYVSFPPQFSRLDENRPKLIVFITFWKGFYRTD